MVQRMNDSDMPGALINEGKDYFLASIAQRERERERERENRLRAKESERTWAVKEVNGTK